MAEPADAMPARASAPRWAQRLILVGVFILTGIDKRLETALVDAAPDWLVDLTTRY